VRVGNEQTKEALETRIRRLEQQETLMLDRMQQTMKKKDRAVETLNRKSPALQKNMEPRGAYSFSRV
jgi:hypothetical protein